MSCRSAIGSSIAEGGSERTCAQSRSRSRFAPSGQFGKIRNHWFEIVSAEQADRWRASNASIGDEPVHFRGRNTIAIFHERQYCVFHRLIPSQPRQTARRTNAAIPASCSAPNRKTGRSACIPSLADRNAIHDCAMLSLRGGSLPRRWRRRWSAHGCGRWRGRMIDLRGRWRAHGCGRRSGRMIDCRGWRMDRRGRRLMIDGRPRRRMTHRPRGLVID